MENSFDVVVIGAGSAGSYAAERAVEHAPGSSVALLNGEERLPYKRTKISKSFAKGYARNEFSLFSEEWYSRNNVALFSATTATRIDREKKRVTLSDGRLFGYRKLVLATGARPRLPPLAGSISDHVHTAYAAREIDRLKAAAAGADSAAVIGMGVLGTEVAEQLRRMGLAVHLVGKHDRMIWHDFDEELSTELEELYRTNGIKLYFNEPEQEVEGEPGEFTVRLKRSRVQITADLVVYAIGLEPRLELPREAGLSCRTAVAVDECLRTSDRDIYAAGDIAEHPDGRITHLWRHAMHQGARAGENAVRALNEQSEERYEFVPFREKCKLFGRYFFALCLPESEELRDYELHRYERGDRLVRAYVKKGTVRGVSMIGDMEREEHYSAAVLGQWSLQSFVKQLEL